jgi:hypothetical protein
MEADRMQLGAETTSQTLASHFVRMFKVWAALADSEPSDDQPQKSN